MLEAYHKGKDVMQDHLARPLSGSTAGTPFRLAIGTSSVVRANEPSMSDASVFVLALPCANVCHRYRSNVGERTSIGLNEGATW